MKDPERPAPPQPPAASERTKGAPDFARLGDLLGDVCGAPPAPAARTGPRSAADPARLLSLVWADAVGEEVAANARPVRLTRGRLSVSTSSSVWAQTLQLMSDAIVARLNERLGQRLVEQVVFRHAGWEERPRVAEPPATHAPSDQIAPLSVEQEEALAQIKRLGLPTHLEEHLTRAMRAAFVRGQQDSVR